MSRKRIISIFTSLLCLLPFLTQAQSLTQYEYWFDDDFGGRVIESMSGTDEAVRLSIKTDQLDNGVHKFSFRAKQSDGYYSAITSSLFLKRVAAQSSKMEYWFDDKFELKDSVDISNTEDEQEFNLDLRDNTKFPWGFHKLNMRITLEGGGESAVYSSPVLKLSAGTATSLEYWIDDDIAHSHTIEGHLASDGKDYIFVNDLDLGDISPGHHRLYCRAKSSSGKTASAVTMTPIIVKSKYHVDNPEALTVTEHSFWIDDEEPEVVPVDKPKNIINQPYTFDTRRLSDGKHTLHVQYGNSAGIWNGPVDYPFTKTKVDPPQITASASVEDGVVTLNYNAVPAGFQYVLVRKYPSGTERRADLNWCTEYPADLKSTDTPAPGTYTYYVKGKYTDASGKEQEVLSGDVNVTVEQAASTVKRGTIYGVLTINGERAPYPWIYDYNVYINGERAWCSKSSFRYGEFGQFSISDVPYGTEITIGVEYHDYYFKDIKLIVSENTCNKPYYFNGTMEGGEDLQPSNDEYDLTMTSDVHFTPDAVELKVCNYSRSPWSGNIIVKMVKKSRKDLYDKNMSEEGLSFLESLLHSNSEYEEEPIYTTVANTHIYLDGKKWNEYNNYKIMSMEIIDMPEEKDKREEYYVYVYSQRDESDQLKLLAGYNFPRTVEINPYDCAIAQEKDYKSYLKDYKDIMTHLKMLSKWGDPFALEIKSFGDDYEDIINNLGSEQYTSQEGVNHDIIVGASQSSGLLLSCFLSDVHKEVKSTAKSLKTSFDVADVFVNLVNTLDGFYSANNVEDNHKFFATCDQVFKFCEKLNLDEYPALKIYKYYFEVGDAMASAIKNLSNKVYSKYIWDRVCNGRAIFNIKVRRYTGTKGVSYFDASEFCPDDTKDFSSDDKYHPGRIKSIDFVLSALGKEEGLPSLSDNKKIVDYETLEITNVDFGSNNNSWYTEDVELWMNITWNNNRVTHVPMLNKDFVKIENLKNQDKPLVITVELQADTHMKKEYISKNITYVKQ